MNVLFYLVLVISGNFVAATTAMGSRCADLLESTYLRVFKQSLSEGLISRADLDSALTSETPYNPLRKKSLDHKNTAFHAAFDRALAQAPSWLELRADLQQLHREWSNLEEGRAAALRSTQPLLSPKVIQTVTLTRPPENVAWYVDPQGRPTLTLNTSGSFTTTANTIPIVSAPKPSLTPTERNPLFMLTVTAREFILRSAASDSMWRFDTASTIYTHHSRHLLFIDKISSGILSLVVFDLTRPDHPRLVTERETPSLHVKNLNLIEDVDGEIWVLQGLQLKRESYFSVLKFANESLEPIGRIEASQQLVGRPQVLANGEILFAVSMRKSETSHNWRLKIWRLSQRSLQVVHTFAPAILGYKRTQLEWWIEDEQKAPHILLSSESEVLDFDLNTRTSQTLFQIPADQSPNDVAIPFALFRDQVGALFMVAGALSDYIAYDFSRGISQKLNLRAPANTNSPRIIQIANGQTLVAIVMGFNISIFSLFGERE